MSLIVQKFGGSSVRDAERLLRVSHRIAETRAAGHDVIAVLSAQGDTTDRLLDAARALAPEPSPRELDALLATGEQASVALCAMTLMRLGVPAVSLQAWQVPVFTDGVHGDARITTIGHARVKEELRAGRVVLVAGFQGVDERGDVTTLGRGGSDTSAVALAAAFGAARCRIYTDVDGVYTTDPRLCPAARRLRRISWAHMRLLASCGAQVLHDRSAALAAREGVTVEVLSCEPDAVGTLVAAAGEDTDVTGVARRIDAAADAAEITAVGRALPSLAYEKRALAALETAGVATRSVAGGPEFLTFTVAAGDADAALCAVHEALLGA